ncbi:transporter, dicarboxylate/amino acid:cation Na+/H+ symporter family protein [Peptoanaerobacter stomatis]|jgi:DAACS family dicarboxylate/amino acid:cation symporter|uniref:Transporter, dicarboxylate/amino acid:cation Na+/H+ symporter family protein n=1 Tax=Peptoanaerobacter stomatis TaxID=796937 RepID=J6HI83_9FIRM|nr:dicarboxylate/amino acid:cation symporter [Peptoanaerobacter stomatis]EJU24640.1 transporter, dicarboxylate/amino acid:cation Na+/H+ symporter family protein [Peptoanaerobacter stomatis]NWO25896.1 dicarboxylate/amino acid:cation symporter [Peptostreptococcaceae bacterium oral taxon 081]
MLETIMKKKNLFIRIAIGFILGIFIGIILPEFSIATKVVGDVYLKLIKMMIVPIIFVAVAGGICNIESTEDLKRIGFKTVGLYVVMFVLSCIVSLIVAYAIRPGKDVIFANPPVFEQEITNPSISDFFINIFPDNPIMAMAEGKILPVIIFTILFSSAIVMSGEKGKPVLDFINSLSTIFFKLLEFVMELSPIGVMSLMAFSVSKYGLGIFSALGKYIITCYIACILTYIFAMCLPLFLYTKMGIVKLTKSMYKVWLVTLSTTSSAATLPTSIKVSMEDYKAPEGITKFTLPLGCTINMCGGACSFSCLAVFVSDFYGINLSFKEIVTLIFVATLINMAAPGIPGGGIILGASFLSILGLPFDLMGPIAAFYRLLDMAFTSLNVTGDLVANLMIAKSEKQWDVSMINE